MPVFFFHGTFQKISLPTNVPRHTLRGTPDDFGEYCFIITLRTASLIDFLSAHKTTWSFFFPHGPYLKALRIHTYVRITHSEHFLIIESFDIPIDLVKG